MKRLALIVASSLVIGLVACATQSIPDSQIGLSKGSVFETQTPQPYTRDGTGVTGDAVTAYGMPPLVPHAVDDYKITQDNNACVACHNPPGMGGAKPFPASHQAQGKLSGAYYYCELCHAPAANVPDLVKNTGPKPAR